MIPYRYLAAVRAANSSSKVQDERSSGESLTTAQQSTMSRLRHAALTVFEEQGFDGTTADEVSQRAGVSRRTFFRYFPTKEDALFADHAVHLGRVDDLLDPDDPDRFRCAASALRAIVEAYVEDADFVRRRARLVDASSALRDRELVWVDVYQRRLGAYLASHARGARDVIWAHIGAATLLTAFRHVLAAWVTGNLRADPAPYFDDIVDEIARTIGGEDKPADGQSGVLVVATKLAPAAIARIIQAAEQENTA